MPGAIMLVEDEPLMADDLADALSRMGYEITAVVASAAQCLAAAEQRSPDLVLMDINLSGDLDGIDAAQMMRDRFDVPVVFLSGSADERTINRAKLAGALGYLLKPFRWSELKSSVEVALFRHRLECQMRDRERWLATTLRAIGDAAIVIDPNGMVSFMNSAAEQLLGERETSVRGRSLASSVRLINENTRAVVPHPLQEALVSGEVVRGPRSTALLTGDLELPVEYTVAPIIDGHGKVSGAVVVIKNLTEQRRAQQQIAVSDRLASLGVVAAGIAHEMNNPLTYVLGNIDFLREELEHLRRLVEGEQSFQAMREARSTFRTMDSLLLDVQQGAGHVAHIVGDLRVFARRDAAKNCDLTERVEWALRVSNSAIVPHAHVARVFQPIPKAGADAGRLGQVFLNLLLNAAYAMHETNRETNRLTVTIEPAPIAAAAHEHRQFIQVTISDTGSGMTEDVARRIFEPFFTTKPPGHGSGLGLPVCQWLLTEMGGDITVISDPGKGSSFIVSVPIFTEDATGEEKSETEAAALRGRVLVVDDDPPVLRALRRMLSANHDVMTSNRAEAALQLIRQQPEFDVIVCDVIMPEMNGAAFYREVVASWPDLASRIIFLSGGAQAEVGDFFAALPNVFLQKPPDKPQLLRAIEHQLTASGRA